MSTGRGTCRANGTVGKLGVPSSAAELTRSRAANGTRVIDLGAGTQAHNRVKVAHLDCHRIA